MLLFIGICYLIYQGVKASVSDANMRSYSQSKGWDTYASQTGLRDVKTGKRCYVDIHGNKTLW
jgi:hypothetical protein